jgi:hypothetical protein
MTKPILPSDIRDLQILINSGLAWRLEGSVGRGGVMGIDATEISIRMAFWMTLRLNCRDLWLATSRRDSEVSTTELYYLSEYALTVNRIATLKN